VPAFVPSLRTKILFGKRPIANGSVAVGASSATRVMAASNCAPGVSTGANPWAMSNAMQGLLERLWGVKTRPVEVLAVKRESP
jgi:hypothetical protein